MEHPILLFCVIYVFWSVMKEVINFMVIDQNVIIRFLGYLLAIVVAVGIFVLILYCYFNINLISTFFGM